MVIMAGLLKRLKRLDEFPGLLVIRALQSKLKHMTRVIFMVILLRLTNFPLKTRNPHRMGQHNSQLLESMVSSSNCIPDTLSILTCVVDKEEIERLRRRFLKLDRDGSGSHARDTSIETDEQDNWTETSFC